MESPSLDPPLDICTSYRRYQPATLSSAPDSSQRKPPSHVDDEPDREYTRAIELIERHYETISNLTGVYFVLDGGPGRLM